MEFLNKIQIRGIVGKVGTERFGDTGVTCFSVITQHMTTEKDGTPAVEVVWLNVSAWGGTAPEGIKKGDWVEIEGRLRLIRYTDKDNVEHRVPNIVASSVKFATQCSEAE